MTTGDPNRLLRLALTGVINADTTLRTLMARTSGLVVVFDASILDGVLPVIAMTFAASQQTGRDGDSRDVVVQFDVIGRTLEVVEEIAYRLESIVWAPLLYAFNGCDAAEDTWNRVDAVPGVEEGDGPRGGTRNLYQVTTQATFGPTVPA